MNNSLTPYDLGTSQLVEHTQRININDLVRQAQKEVKMRLLEAQIEALGVNVGLTTSKTRFNGERVWFVCPVCGQRSGIIYSFASSNIGCRKCLGLKYKKQRFKGMVENQNSM